MQQHTPTVPCIVVAVLPALAHKNSSLGVCINNASSAVAI